MGCGASHEPHYFQPGNYIFVGAAKPHGWREGYKVAFILLEDGSFKVGLSKYTWFHDSDQYQWVKKPEDSELSESVINSSNVFTNLDFRQLYLLCF